MDSTQRIAKHQMISRDLLLLLISLFLDNF